MGPDELKLALRGCTRERGAKLSMEHPSTLEGTALEGEIGHPRGVLEQMTEDRHKPGAVQSINFRDRVRHKRLGKLLVGG